MSASPPSSQGQKKMKRKGSLEGSLYLMSEDQCPLDIMVRHRRRPIWNINVPNRVSTTSKETIKLNEANLGMAIPMSKETSELCETNLCLVLPGGILIEIFTMKGLTPYIWRKTSVVCKLWAKAAALRPTMKSVFANIAITDRESSLINNPTDIARILGCGFAWNLHLNANTLYQFSSHFTHEEINRLDLHSLTLDHAMSKDMATLSAFKSLTKLCITRCDVLDLNWVSDSALKSLQRLEISDIVGSFDFSLAPLKMLPNLIELCIMQNAFEGKLAQTDIASLQKLETLSIGESDLRQLDALSAFSSLRELNLSSYVGTSLGGISGLTALESLDLSWSENLEDVTALSSLKVLRVLNLMWYLRTFYHHTVLSQYESLLGVKKSTI